MLIRDPHNFAGGLNADDAPDFLPEGDYPDAVNVRTGGSDQQHGAGPAETLQSEICIPINPDVLISYYGDAIGGQFLYTGYAEVIIGTQTWMKRNFDKPYPGSKAYDDVEANINTYGRLYSHNQIMEDDFCPDGWHVPTEAEVDILLSYLGGEMIAGGALKEVGDSHWTDPNTGADDSSAFRAIPGGKFDLLFDLLGKECLLWIADDGCPLAPTNLRATNITIESFVANWDASDGADGYYLDVSESAAFSTFVSGYQNKDVGSVLSAFVSGLTENTTYYYRLRAYNELCTSDDSDIAVTATSIGLIDMDGNIYHRVIIGDQEWTIENLRTTTYANGDAIPNVTDDTEWENGIPNSDNKTDYGGLYNWYAVDTGKLAPTGCHVPSWSEVDTMIAFLGGVTMTMGAHLKETGLTYWFGANTADNSTGFSARGGGERIVGWNGAFTNLGHVAPFWTTDVRGGTNYYGFAVENDTALVIGCVYPSGNYKGEGCGVRCLLDDPGSWNPGDIITDIDGNDYHTVQIGTQVWLVENLKVEHFNDGTDIPMSGANPPVFTNAEWAALVTPAMCYYDDTSIILDAYCWFNNDIANKEIYGALYNWLAVDKSKELAVGQFTEAGVTSVGWRVPSDSDIRKLINFLGGYAIAGGKLKEIGITYWQTPNTGATDIVGFRARGTGYRLDTGEFSSLGLSNFLWESEEFSSQMAKCATLYSDSAGINVGANDKRYGFSVHCVRDLIPTGDRIGDAEFRLIVRDGSLCTDKAITALGFSGVEDVDWINLKKLP